MRLVVGAILILIALFIAGPIGLFVVGALWSMLFGEVAVESKQAVVASPAADG